jgi:hypothetical protein
MHVDDTFVALPFQQILQKLVLRLLFVHDAIAIVVDDVIGGATDEVNAFVACA